MALLHSGEKQTNEQRTTTDAQLTQLSAFFSFTLLKIKARYPSHPAHQPTMLPDADLVLNGRVVTYLVPISLATIAQKQRSTLCQVLPEMTVVWSLAWMAFLHSGWNKQMSNEQRKPKSLTQLSAFFSFTLLGDQSERSISLHIPPHPDANFGITVEVVGSHRRNNRVSTKNHTHHLVPGLARDDLGLILGCDCLVAQRLEANK